MQSDWDSSGAAVYVGGEYSGELSTFGSRDINGLISGTYTVELEKSGYKTWSKQVTITTSQTTTVYAYIEPGTGIATTRQEIISYDSAFGSLLIDVGQSEVSFFVNGEYSGTTGTWNDRQIDGLMEGKYTISLTKLGYEDASIEATVVAGKTTELSVELSPDASQQDPNQPSHVEITNGIPGFNSVQLYWSENLDNDFSYYEIFVSTSNTAIGESAAGISEQSTTEYKIIDLNPSTTYYFRVRVWNTANEFSDSTPYLITTTANEERSFFIFDDFTLILIILFAAFVVPLIAVAAYRRRNSQNNYQKTYEQAKRERAESEWRRTAEERAKEEQKRREEQWHYEQQRQRSADTLRDAFDTLGIPYNATRQQVKNAWRELCKKWHPDMFKDSDERAKELASEKFHKINAAYEEILQVKGWSK